MNNQKQTALILRYLKTQEFGALLNHTLFQSA